jgi:hypothetical protein
MALRTHNLPSEHFKNDFGEVDEVTIHDVERLLEIILCILGIEKNDFYEIT